MKYADVNALLCELGQDVIIKDPVTGQERADTVIRTADLCGDKVPSPWISVNERLPEKGAWVLAWIKDESEPYPTVGSFDGDEREIGVWRRWVTHWMPLPGPPEVEE